MVTTALFLGACGSDEANEQAKVVQEEVVQEESSVTEASWQDQIKEIANSDGSETEKHDRVMLEVVKAYEPTEEEIAQFEQDIINEFTTGNYLSDITNHEYMLTNLFKSGVVEEYYDDSAQYPMDAFAFDFLQNTKYTYRGVDAVDSEAVKSNEDQMKKALEKIQ